jgi:hypothetical protein
MDSTGSGQSPMTGLYEDAYESVPYKRLIYWPAELTINVSRKSLHHEIN